MVFVSLRLILIPRRSRVRLVSHGADVTCGTRAILAPRFAEQLVNGRAICVLIPPNNHRGLRLTVLVFGNDLQD